MNSAEDFIAVPLEDVNGNGVPDLVFIVWSDMSAWSGDAQCCYTTHVLELGKKFSGRESVGVRMISDSRCKMSAVLSP